MSKLYKIVFYISACIVVFVILAKIYENSFATRRAEAFEWEKIIDVYFVDSAIASNSDCSAVRAFPRTILNAETLGPGALEALFMGITKEEEAMGYITSINNGVLVKQFEIKNGTAYVDLSPEFNKGVGGSCMVTSIRSQVEQTLLALPDINQVVLSINGETEGILEP